ncbi:MAG: S49 family peptidase, partial [Candidatus Dormibacteraeota bacterium]|nr:S49 family peptidase [Candidatus Dormibacteraeota bacterium]
LSSRKPLVAAMGAYAAPGGYYVATPARRIFAQPGTLTGSIGVLGGKLAVGGLLRRLLVGREVIARGSHAGIDDPGRPYSEGEREKVREGIDRVYGIFLDRVARGRGRPRSDIEPIAGGRVWTGRQAVDHGLVDELAGLDGALAEARRLGRVRDDVPLVELPDRGQVAPLASGAAVALETLRALTLAPAWLLCPLLDAEVLGLPL